MGKFAARKAADYWKASSPIECICMWFRRTQPQQLEIIISQAEPLTTISDDDVRLWHGGHPIPAGKFKPMSLHLEKFISNHKLSNLGIAMVGLYLLLPLRCKAS